MNQHSGNQSRDISSTSGSGHMRSSERRDIIKKKHSSHLKNRSLEKHHSSTRNNTKNDEKEEYIHSSSIDYHSNQQQKDDSSLNQSVSDGFSESKEDYGNRKSIHKSSSGERKRKGHNSTKDSISSDALEIQSKYPHVHDDSSNSMKNTSSLSESADNHGNEYVNYDDA
ncbi:hypothetical protein WA158_000945 [Blastocystis sp. Blastoise]